MSGLAFPKEKKKEKEGYGLYNSSIKTKTPLKAKTTLKAKTALKTKTPLKANSTLSTNKPLTSKSTLSAKPVTEPKIDKKPKKKVKQAIYKPKYPYASIFTDDLTTCFLSGQKTNVEMHHIFGASRKEFSEKYHFILPLTTDWHTAAPHSIHRDAELNLRFKLRCQEYWINELGKTKEEWIAEAGKWWVEKNKKVAG